MSTGVLDLGLTVSSVPSGNAGGDLGGSYPDPVVVTVGGSAAADINTATALVNTAQSGNKVLASPVNGSSGAPAFRVLTTADISDATDAATASRIVKRDANANAQFAAVVMNHVSAGVDNLGMGGPASASAAFPLLIQRDYAGALTTQTANPNAGAGSGAKDQLSVDSGNNVAEMGLFSALTVAPDAYAGGRLTVRSSGGTAGISIIADDVVTADIKHYVAGNGSGNLALKTSPNLITTSYGGITLDTAGSRPVAGATYRGLMFVTQGAPGAIDTLSVCLKNADNSYSWVDIVSGAP